eukprot:GHVT01000733.1.p1 GENE.GHVT01000733.1~~GHVT01000733.1.p1  ORF type:complete len:668 (+),score=79.20 GHVT01000733.1:944-2947(+)
MMANVTTSKAGSGFGDSSALPSPPRRMGPFYSFPTCCWSKFGGARTDRSRRLRAPRGFGCSARLFVFVPALALALLFWVGPATVLCAVSESPAVREPDEKVETETYDHGKTEMSSSDQITSSEEMAASLVENVEPTYFVDCPENELECRTVASSIAELPIEIPVEPTAPPRAAPSADAKKPLVPPSTNPKFSSTKFSTKRSQVKKSKSHQPAKKKAPIRKIGLKVLVAIATLLGGGILGAFFVKLAQPDEDVAATPNAASSSKASAEAKPSISDKTNLGAGPTPEAGKSKPAKVNQVNKTTGTTSTPAQKLGSAKPTRQLNAPTQVSNSPTGAKVLDQSKPSPTQLSNSSTGANVVDESKPMAQEQLPKKVESQTAKPDSDAVSSTAPSPSFDADDSSAVSPKASAGGQVSDESQQVPAQEAPNKNCPAKSFDDTLNADKPQMPPDTPVTNAIQTNSANTNTDPSPQRPRLVSAKRGGRLVRSASPAPFCETTHLMQQTGISKEDLATLADSEVVKGWMEHINEVKNFTGSDLTKISLECRECRFEEYFQDITQEYKFSEPMLLVAEAFQQYVMDYQHLDKQALYRQKNDIEKAGETYTCLSILFDNLGINANTDVWKAFSDKTFVAGFYVVISRLLYGVEELPTILANAKPRSWHRGNLFNLYYRT